MEILEEERRKKLEDKIERDLGLIIPVILRGPDKFPSAIKAKRQHYQFDEIDLADPEVKIRSRYASQIRMIAKYIINCYEKLDELSDHMNVDLCSSCNEFILPSDDDVKDYVEGILGKKMRRIPVPFPGSNDVRSSFMEGR